MLVAVAMGMMLLGAGLAGAPTSAAQTIVDEERTVPPVCEGDNGTWTEVCAGLKAHASVRLDTMKVHDLEVTRTSQDVEVNETVGPVEEICPLICTPEVEEFSVTFREEVEHHFVNTTEQVVNVAEIDAGATPNGTVLGVYEDNACEDLGDFGIPLGDCPPDVLGPITDLIGEIWQDPGDIDPEDYIDCCIDCCDASGPPITHLADAEDDDRFDGVIVDVTPEANDPTPLYVGEDDLVPAS